jgi:hypothetical protein
MIVYLDNAASTPPLPEVLAAVTHAMTDLYANPSSAHGLGAAAARALEQARGEVAGAAAGPALGDRVLRRWHRGQCPGPAGRSRPGARPSHGGERHRAPCRSAFRRKPGQQGLAAEQGRASARWSRDRGIGAGCSAARHRGAGGDAGQQRDRHSAASGRNRPRPARRGPQAALSRRRRTVRGPGSPRRRDPGR